MAGGTDRRLIVSAAGCLDMMQLSRVRSVRCGVAGRVFGSARPRRRATVPPGLVSSSDASHLITCADITACPSRCTGHCFAIARCTGDSFAIRRNGRMRKRIIDLMTLTWCGTDTGPKAARHSEAIAVEGSPPPAEARPGHTEERAISKLTLYPLLIAIIVVTSRSK